jgi:hypothetical protein
MLHTTRQAAKPEVGTWESGFCSTSFCKERFFSVQRCAESSELWRIALTPGKGEWLVAAPGPLCPLCGGTLLTPAPSADEMKARNRWS